MIQVILYLMLSAACHTISGGKFDDYGKLIHYPVREFTEKRGIVIKTGTSIGSINADMKSVTLSDGSTEKFDRLIICSGAHPRIEEKFKNSGAVAIRSLDRRGK